MRTRRLPTLWRSGTFLVFWTGHTVSAAGTQVSLLAVPLIAIVTLGASPGQVGLLGSLALFPVFAVTPLAGVLVDRVPIRPLLVSANLGRALLLAVLPLLAWLDRLELGWLYGIALLVGALTALADVAYLSFVPSVVPESHLVEANSKLEAGSSVAELSGRGVGGVLVQWLTAPVAVLVDVVSYVFAGLAVLAVRVDERARTRGPLPSRRVGPEIVEGLRTVLAHSTLRPLLILSAAYNFCEQLVLTVFLLFATRFLHVGPAAIGVLMALGGVGGVAGATVATEVGRRVGPGRSLLLGITLAAAAPGLIPAAALGMDDGRPTAAVYLSVGAGFLLYGAGMTLFNVHAVSLRQQVVPAAVLGRVNASYRVVTYGALPLGALVGGVLGARAGLLEAEVIGVAGALLAAGAFAFSPVARLGAGRGPGTGRRRALS